MKKIILIVLAIIVSASSYASGKEPLWTGRYRQSGQGYCVENGQYSQSSFPDRVVTINVYDDHITVDGVWYDYKKTIGYGTKVYVSNGWGGVYMYYYVLLDRTMYLETRSSQFSGITVRYSMESLDE